ncbi:MAG: hypothetical protein CMF80_09330 [Candidatus Marinimicrobia bacterium]|jgi:hypothetical protein|nr:hypothetical protein [Candidatus Neomarinimicrobiota bacterium]
MNNLSYTILLSFIFSFSFSQCYSNVDRDLNINNDNLVLETTQFLENNPYYINTQNITYYLKRVSIISG